MQTRRNKNQTDTERHTPSKITEMLNRLAIIFLRQQPESPDRCFEAVENEEKITTTN